MCKLLLKHKSNPNVQNLVFGKTPLHIAVENGNIDIIQELISYNADVDIIDRNGKKSIDSARDVEIQKILREKTNVNNEFPIIECRQETIGDSLEHSLDDFKLIFKETPHFDTEEIEKFLTKSVIEPECERASLSNANIRNTTRTYSFGGDLNKNTLYK